jgi:hypothetical protein
VKITSSIAVALIAALAAVCNPVSAAAAAAPDTESIIREIMADQYHGAYDAQHSCWAYSFRSDNAELTQYCMRPLKSQVVEEKGVNMLYLIAVNATDIADNPDYNYSQADSGLMGVFKVSLGGTQGWTYKAFDSEMALGFAGQCGCSDIQLVQLNNAGEHAWLFITGGTWQGVTNASFSLLMPVKGNFKNLSRIPQSQGEENPGVSYQISVKPDPAAKGLFPLHVIKLESDQKIDELDVPFDSAKSVYALPATL